MGPWWIPEFSESNFRGQNSMACGILYIIGKILESLKWTCIAHLDIWNTSYGQKKGRKSNCKFDSRPQKVKNRPDLLIFRGRAIYHWKALDESYNFASNCISIEGLHTKLWGSKVVGVSTWAILGLPLWSPVTKSQLDVGSMASHKLYYKGEGGSFPQVWVVVNLMCPSCPWLVLAPPTMH
jgi:hypothetical protein